MKKWTLTWQDLNTMRSICMPSIRWGVIHYVSDSLRSCERGGEQAMHRCNMWNDIPILRSCYNQLSVISSELSFMWNIWKSEDDVFHIAQTMESVHICLNNISEKIYPTATVLLVFNSPVLLLQLMTDCLWLF